MYEIHSQFSCILPHPYFSFEFLLLRFRFPEPLSMLAWPGLAGLLSVRR